MRYYVDGKLRCAALLMGILSVLLLPLLVVISAGDWNSYGVIFAEAADATVPPSLQKASEQITKAVPRIAVIGGGVGGTSATYYLRKLLGPSALIDLYEPSAIGGRVASINVAGQDYESGGSIIHPANMYMVNFREEFGLKVRDTPSSLSGFYNGEEFVLIESSWSIVTIMRMLWRYGLDCFYILSRVSSMLSSFSRIYTLQDEGHTYTTPTELVHAMGGDDFVNWTHTPLQLVLKQWGFSDRFIDEMISVATRVNYGQSTDITAFAGMVSVAGVQSGLWAVHGGNRLIPQALLNASKAVWHRAKVSSIRNATTTDKTKFEVTATSPLANEAQTAEYDMVVVATPLTPNVGSNIDFHGFTSSISTMGGSYQRTVATFIQGKPNHETFGRKADEFLPDVLTTCNISLDIRSLSSNFAVDRKNSNQTTQDHVYKVFSGDLLNDQQMKALFVSYDIKEPVNWLAYPHYTVDDKLPSFILSDGLFYINGIEWVASAMEMSVIGARNVALLAKNHWQKVDASSSMQQQYKQQRKEL